MNLIVDNTIGGYSTHPQFMRAGTRLNVAAYQAGATRTEDYMKPRPNNLTSEGDSRRFASNAETAGRLMARRLHI